MANRPAVDRSTVVRNDTEYPEIWTELQSLLKEGYVEWSGNKFIWTRKSAELSPSMDRLTPEMYVDRYLLK